MRGGSGTPTAGAPIVLAGPTALLRLGGTSRVSFSAITFEHTATESAGVLAGADSQSADRPLVRREVPQMLGEQREPCDLV